MKAHETNKLNNFIGGWYIKKSVCDDLIKFYNKSRKIKGMLSGYKVNDSVKRSMDVLVNYQTDDELILKYYDELEAALKHYQKLYPYVNKVYQWGIVSNWNIQKYKPQEGFLYPHCERGDPRDCLRHLVFMTYLNDVTDGGETEFIQQKLKVKPEKGLTLFWPTDWTHYHQGIVSPTQTKYIATGWYKYHD